MSTIEASHIEHSLDGLTLFEVTIHILLHSVNLFFFLFSLSSPLLSKEIDNAQ
jgi:hypothetical protein